MDEGSGHEKVGDSGRPANSEAGSGQWRLADGSQVGWRPLGGHDHLLLGRFLAGLSRRTCFERFLSGSPQPTPTLLAQMARADFRSHPAFVVTRGSDDDETIIADARFVIDSDSDSAHFALVVADAWQGRGIGTRLLQLLADTAAARGLRWLRGDVRDDNLRMLALMRRCGFFRAPHPDDETLVQGVKLLLPPYPPERLPHGQADPSGVPPPS